jgi:protein-tyrosine phosphatase
MNPSESNPTRKRFNEIIPGKLYQRGQILTWKYGEKKAALEAYNIGIVVNLWPKIDSDLSALVKVCYLYLPVEDMQSMMAPYVETKAQEIAKLITDTKSVCLVMCEAGHGRSVYFSTLVTHYFGYSYTEALAMAMKAVPSQSMKPFMFEYLTKETRK